MGCIESLSIMMETIFACTSVALLTSGGRTSRQKQVTRRPDERCGVVRLALRLPHLMLASIFAFNRKGKPRGTAAKNRNF
ncbi:hypothetical protein KCU59_g118, partial [Aureobasidium melanogenum]